MSKKGTHTTSSKRFLPWTAFIVLILGASVITAVYWKQNLTVNSVVVQGNYFTPSDDIIQEAGIELGVHPDSIDLAAMDLRIDELTYIFETSSYIDPLGTLKIVIKERYPIALLVHGNNEVYVDSYGVKLPILPGRQINLPLVYGFDTRLNSLPLNSDEFNQIRDFLLSAMRNPIGWTTISEVAYNPIDGVVALSHENGVKLLFGENEFDVKIKNWEVFYSEVISVKGINAMQQVDLRFTNQVVTREVGS